MERFVYNLKILWRAERLLAQNETRLLSQKLQFNALAGLVALFGLVMLSLAVFFALVPHWGHSLAALAVGATDIVLAVLLIGYAGSLKPAPEIEMIREVREAAVSDLNVEVARADAELAALKDEAHRFLRNPVESLLPAAIGPLLGAAVKGLSAQSK